MFDMHSETPSPLSESEMMMLWGCSLAGRTRKLVVFKDNNI